MPALVPIRPSLTHAEAMRVDELALRISESAEANWHRVLLSARRVGNKLRYFSAIAEFFALQLKEIYMSAKSPRGMVRIEHSEIVARAIAEQAGGKSLRLLADRLGVSEQTLQKTQRGEQIRSDAAFRVVDGLSIAQQVKIVPAVREVARDAEAAERVTAATTLLDRSAPTIPLQTIQLLLNKGTIEQVLDLVRFDIQKEAEQRTLAENNRNQEEKLRIRLESREKTIEAILRNVRDAAPEKFSDWVRENLAQLTPGEVL